MVKDKIDDIISMLIKSTECGDLIWFVKKNDSTYKNERSLSATSEDGMTEFETSIKYILNGDSWYIESNSSLWMRNKDLPGGSMYLTSHNYTSLGKLRDILKTKYCSDMSPSTAVVEDKLTDIYKGISKSTFRDTVINKLFGNGKK